jgi:hypothetical protein
VTAGPGGAVDPSAAGGLDSWLWILIGILLIVVLVFGFLLGRRRPKDDRRA